MANGSLEERIKSLEDKNRILEKKVQRAEDRQQCENIMAKYCYLHMAMLHQEQADQAFAVKSPGTAVQLGSTGIWDGHEGVVRCYPGLHSYWDAKSSPDGKTTGHMSQHTLTTPYIEIAGDGKTAKGVWMSPGQETAFNRDTGKWRTEWLWGYYGIDFIKEDGKWRIWHLRVYITFRCPYDQDWVAAAPEDLTKLTSDIPDEFKPDRHAPYITWRYGPNRPMEYDPKLPEPYETWDDSTSYIEMKK